MAPTINFLVILILSISLGLSSLASPVLNSVRAPAIQEIHGMSPRTDDDCPCPDATLARTLFQAYSGARTSHDIALHHIIVNANSIQGTGPDFLTLQGPVFKAWTTQQNFTVPLFRLATSGGLEQVFMTGIDAQTPPVLNGFSAIDISAWVFNQSACGTVPLMSAGLASQTDHYYTTDPDEHSGLIADGWKDGGVVAFVLPLPAM